MNKDLAPQRGLKMVLGQLRGPALVDRITPGYPNQLLIVAHAWVCVCDGRHSCS